MEVDPRKYVGHCIRDGRIQPTWAILQIEIAFA